MFHEVEDVFHASQLRTGKTRGPQSFRVERFRIGRKFEVLQPAQEISSPRPIVGNFTHDTLLHLLDVGQQLVDDGPVAEISTNWDSAARTLFQLDRSLLAVVNGHVHPTIESRHLSKKRTAAFVQQT